MTEEMKKLRDKLAHAYATGNNTVSFADTSDAAAFSEGFDACYKEMQAQLDESNKALEAQGKAWKQTCELMVFERDSLKAQVDELMKSNKEMSDLIYSEDGYIESQDSLIQERDTLKQQLEIALNALETIKQKIQKMRGE